MSTARPVLAIVVFAFLVLAFGGRPGVARSCAPQERWLVRWDSTYAATVKRPASIYRKPGRTPFMQVGVADAYGFATTLQVIERVQLCKARWYRVRVAARPNGATGWISSMAVTTTRLRTRIVIDLSQHHLFLFKRGKIALSSPVAIGKPSTPTPVGSFYVTQRFVVTSRRGPYGPRALGISAFSDVLRNWVDGGPIGIHGTNEPFAIGNSVSHGCVRMPNDKILRLFAVTPLGTPVQIRR
jgi:lipoprotein-anchoring transpeptidase ErfK/SrfK